MVVDKADNSVDGKVGLMAIVTVEQLGPWMGENMVVKKDVVTAVLTDTPKVRWTELPMAVWMAF